MTFASFWWSVCKHKATVSLQNLRHQRWHDCIIHFQLTAFRTKYAIKRVSFLMLLLQDYFSFTLNFCNMFGFVLSRPESNDCYVKILNLNNNVHTVTDLLAGQCIMYFIKRCKIYIPDSDISVNRFRLYFVHLVKFL